MMTKSDTAVTKRESPIFDMGYVVKVSTETETFEAVFTGGGARHVATTPGPIDQSAGEASRPVGIAGVDGHPGADSGLHD